MLNHTAEKCAARTLQQEGVREKINALLGSEVLTDTGVIEAKAGLEIKNRRV